MRVTPPDRARQNPVIVLMSLQIAAFVAGALMHFGALLPDLQHWRAAIAESVIATALVLGLGLFLAYRRPGIAMTAQICALLGTVLGLVMILIGVGPQSSFDYILHALMFILLIAGLVVTSVSREPTR
jgi:hypothetical protein